MVERTCSVDDCSARHCAKGLCSRHYQRQYRTGQVKRLCACGKPAHSRTSSAVCLDCRTDNHHRAERDCRLRADYGMAPGDYDKILDAQHGRCKICATDDPGRGHRNFSVDHDHVTGQIRGLLCFSCNVGIGHLGDDPSRLRKAMAYIEAHRQLRLAL